MDNVYRENININGIYKHYKGNCYKVLGIIWNAQTDDRIPWVLYQGLYNHPFFGNYPIFMRSLEQFLEVVIINDMPTARFVYQQQADVPTTMPNLQ